MIITEEISLKPRYFGRNMKKHLLNKLKEKYEGKCTQEYGYIIEIKDNISIISNRISCAESEVLFKVRFNSNNLKPENDLEMNGVVAAVFNEGALVTIYDGIEFFISAKFMKSWDYDMSSATAVSKTKNRNWKISAGDKVIIKATDVRYDDKKFKCVGIISKLIKKEEEEDEEDEEDEEEEDEEDEENFSDSDSE